jgi:hypothetical protein
MQMKGNNMFDAPTMGSTNSVRPADLEGHVVVVEPLEYVSSISTTFGETDAIRVNVHDISEKASHDDVLFFSTALVGSFKRDIGKKLLGKLGKGDAKPGQSPPWILVDLTSNEKAVAAASKYMNERTAGSLSAPSTATASAKAASDLDDLLL